MAGETQHSTICAKPSFTINAAELAGLGSVASFKTQVSRTSFKVRFRTAQRDFAPLGLDKGNGFLVSHGFSGIAFLRRRQRRRQPETDDLAANYGCAKHIAKLTYTSLSSKRWIASLSTWNFKQRREGK